MDRFTIHLGGLTRRHPAQVPLAHLGWLPQKRERVRTTFTTINFSVILAGRGEYRLRGKVHPVVAPMVLTQWPGEAMDYGPDRTWSELYLIYDPAHEADLRRIGLLVAHRPWWRIHQARSVRHLADDIFRLTRDLEGAVDRLDRLAELLIVESLLGRGGEDADPPLDHGQEGGEAAMAQAHHPGAQVIESLRRRIEAAPEIPVDMDLEARRCGFSPTHLRRLWSQHVGGTPARYAMTHRLGRASRMLAEGMMPVTEVANDCGFEDPLHFSRRFRSAYGLSPSAYRRRWIEVGSGGMPIAADASME